MFKFLFSCCMRAEPDRSDAPKSRAAVSPSEQPSGSATRSVEKSEIMSSREQLKVQNAAASWKPAKDHKVIPFAKIDNHRRFHNVQGSPYVLPADVNEQERLVLQHKLVTFGFGCYPYTLFHLPIEDQLQSTGLKILDSGCGPGAWARQVAKTYPKANVVAMDMAKTVLNDAEWNAVENLTFVQGNLLERLPFEDNTFDAVYQRFLVAGIPKAKWVDVMKELVRITKPDGYIEIVETNLKAFQLGPLGMELSGPFTVAMEARGIDIEAGLNAKSYMEEAGIQIINEAVHSAPNGWGGRFGELQAINVKSVRLAMKPFITKALSISDEYFDEMLEKSQEECVVYQTYTNNYAYVGKVLK